MTILIFIIILLLSYIVGGTMGLLVFLFVVVYTLDFSSKKYGLQNVWKVATWGVPYANHVTPKLPSTREDKKTMLLDLDDLEIGHNRDTNEVYALLEVKSVVYTGITCYAMVAIPSNIRPDTNEIVRFQNSNLWTLLSEPKTTSESTPETSTTSTTEWYRSEDIVEHTKLEVDTVRKQAKELAEFHAIKNYKLRVGNEVYFSPEIVEKLNLRNAKYPPLSALKGYKL